MRHNDIINQCFSVDQAVECFVDNEVNNKLHFLLYSFQTDISHFRGLLSQMHISIHHILSVCIVCLMLLLLLNLTAASRHTQLLIKEDLSSEH